ncbi:MAG: 2Fe-2S iron-sulfur cluster binding domain-containing protein [Deltaproteobacteria bacterium]|nr:2Fe-2S iron-sulfur cluster binding domain-containing protein [Deltaproteobacteria bacterium]
MQPELGERPGSYLVTLHFEDDEERRIEVRPNEFVLDAALRQDVPLVHQCRSGSCSTCIAQLVAGKVEMAAERPTSLLAAEAAEGKRLLCSSYARANSNVRLHYPSTLIYGTQLQSLHAKVAALQWPSGSVAKLSLEIAEDTDFNFESGQYVRLKVPGAVEWRSYSMASTARDLPRMDFLVRILNGGLVSEYLRTRCHPGDEIVIQGPMGAFILHSRRAPQIFIAGGTGLAPILAMIDEIRYRPGPRPQILLSFGCASEQQFFYRDEIELRQWWMPELKVILTADQVDESDSGLRQGTPVAALEHEAITDPQTAAYLCGPAAMIEAARRRLTEMGVAPDHIYAEQFVASAIEKSDQS